MGRENSNLPVSVRSQERRAGIKILTIVVEHNQRSLVVLELVPFVSPSHQRYGIGADKVDDFFVSGRFFVQRVSFVLVFGPKYLRHVNDDAFLRHVKAFSHLGIESVHEFESSTHFIGGYNVLVEEIGFAIEIAHDGDFGTVHVIGDTQHMIFLLRGGLSLIFHEVDNVLLLPRPVILVDTPLAEHLEHWPTSDSILIGQFFLPSSVDLNNWDAPVRKFGWMGSCEAT